MMQSNQGKTPRSRPTTVFGGGGESRSFKPLYSLERIVDALSTSYTHGQPPTHSLHFTVYSLHVQRLALTTHTLTPAIHPIRENLSLPTKHKTGSKVFFYLITRLSKIY